jgi:hypothetical protein
MSRSWATAVVAAAFAAVVALATTGSSAAGAAPALMHTTAALGTPTTSSNWSGYAVTGTNASGSDISYSSVTGTWTVPAVNCATGSTDQASSVWVGLGGYSLSSQALEQVGTDSDCSDAGVPNYFAWYELVPANAVLLKAKIKPGDTISTSVNVLPATGAGLGTVELQIINRTRNWRVTKKLQPSALDTTSAEWIVEAPSSCTGTRCDILPLANFGSVTIGKIAAIGDSSPGTLSNTAWTQTPLQLVPHVHRSNLPGPDQLAGSSSSTAGAAPAAFSVDGRSFSVAWQADATTSTGG